MDVSLLKKMNIYPTKAASAGLIPAATTGESTLVKADISRFHEMPLAVAPSQSEVTPDVLPPNEEPNIDAPEQASETADYETGLRDGRAQSDVVYEDTIALLQKSVDAMQTNLGQMAKDIEQSHMAALSECFRAMMPSLAQTATDLELQSVISQAFSAASEGSIHVRVHPDDHIHTQRLCQSHGGNISVTADASLPPQDVRVEWVSGGAEINCQAAAEACLALLGNAQNAMKPVNSTETIDG